MPVFQLRNEIVFPPPEFAEEKGLLAVGGDLSEERLLVAYSKGIFPWYLEGSPILWWSPDPRLVLLPGEVKVSRSLRQTIKNGVFRVTMDNAFDEVIRGCAETHKGKDRETWITDEMIEAYLKLHHSGYAHSVESWYGKELAGGLYGLSLGASFFGESMFTRRTDASKVAFVSLVRQLIHWNFEFIDCQVTTGHLISLGAKEIPRCEFLRMLRHALKADTRRGRWVCPPATLREVGWGGGA